MQEWRIRGLGLLGALSALLVGAVLRGQEPAAALLQQAQAALAAGDPAAARAGVQHAAAALFGAAGPGADAGPSVDRLSGLAAQVGEFEVAIRCAEWLAARLPDPATDANGYAQARQRWAIELQRAGRYDDAVAVYRQSVAALAAAPGVGDGALVTALLRLELADALRTAGDLFAALPVGEQAHARISADAAGSANLPAACAGLAAIRSALGDLEGALLLRQQAVAALADDAPPFVRIGAELALLQSQRDRAMAAVPADTDRLRANAAELAMLLERCEAQGLPAERRDVQVALARVQADLGRNDEAMALLQPLRDELQRSGSQPALLASVEQSIGVLHGRRGDLDAALRISADQLHAARAALPPGHPRRQRLLMNHASLLASQACAGPVAERAAGVQAARALLQTALAEAQERLQQLQGWSLAAREEAYRQLGSLVSSLLSCRDGPAAATPSPLAAEELVAVTALRGLVDRAARWQVAVSAAAAGDRELAAALAAVDERRAQLAAAPAAAAATARAALRDAEVQLRARAGALPGTAALQRRWTIDDLAALLGEGEAAIVTQHYQHASMMRPGTEQPRPEPRVAAFVLAGGNGDVARIDLGELRLVERGCQAFRAQLIQAARLSARGLLRGRAGEATAADGPDAAWLAAMQPLWSALPAGTRRLCVVADGALATVPFEALPAGDGLLADRCSVYYAENLTVLAAAEPPAAAGGMVVLGGVDYGRGDADLDAALVPDRLLLAAASRQWPPLPGALREGELVAARAAAALGAEHCRELSGTAASLSALRAAAQGARFLHLATHGYVLPSELWRDARGQVIPGVDRELVSGLVLATGAAPGDRLGILTAADAAAFDLRGCRLVVLSACETNLGAHLGEALAGMNRAFVRAGARATIGSLWPVVDDGAATLFAAFYEHLFAGGEAPLRALERARADVRAAGWGPGVWAAFVFHGRP